MIFNHSIEKCSLLSPQFPIFWTPPPHPYTYTHTSHTHERERERMRERERDFPRNANVLHKPVVNWQTETEINRSMYRGRSIFWQKSFVCIRT